MLPSGPVTSVETDGVGVHTFCTVRVPAPAEPSDGAAPAADGAGERLARRCREPRARLLRASARQLRQLWSAGLRHVVGFDAAPYGWTTFSRLPRRGSISTRMTQRHRAGPDVNLPREQRRERWRSDGAARDCAAAHAAEAEAVIEAHCVDGVKTSQLLVCVGD
ncbi:hypothetical protein KFE25_002772 [Diacronema lutheri]|uniref:Uncharacterized protein n=1 Tax=Diacronema lutheri TaxID=2081491 RepID=A0A8J5XNP8_DIALT|nr:hypothetical protein KFE25_002772 [Diacronema lutheri]